MKANPQEIKDIALSKGFGLHAEESAIGKLDFRRDGVVIDYFVTKCTVVVKNHPQDQYNQSHRHMNAIEFGALLDFLSGRAPVVTKPKDIKPLEKAMDNLLLANPKTQPEQASKLIQAAIDAFEEFKNRENQLNNE